MEELTARQAARRAHCDPRTAQRMAAKAINAGDPGVRRIGKWIVADADWWAQALATATVRGRKPRGGGTE